MRGMGYTPKSAVERPIKNGQKYDKYFQRIEGKRIVLKRDGNVHDTVALMKKMVDDYSYQTDKIAKNVLAVYKNGKLDKEATAKNVWQFVYDYIKYNYEDGEQLQTPAHTWYQAQILARQNPSNLKNSADCDCMAIFCGCCFKSLGIPFSFRIAGYSDMLGLVHGFQHVYAIAHCDGRSFFCDPVTNEFDYEKTPAIKETYEYKNMSNLSGTDIIMLSGIDPENDAGLVYEEYEDGSLGLLGGRKAKKVKKAERKEKKQAKKEAKKDKKQAKKEVKSARKELKKAKRSGDQNAIAIAKSKKQEAKSKKQEAKQRIDENRTGIAKVVSKAGKVVKKGTMLVPRAMFLLLLRLNFRGMARKFSNNQKAYDKFASVWKRVFGGKTDKLLKAIDKGKNKKALFGAKKNIGNLGEQLDDIGEVYYDLGYITDDFLDGLQAQCGENLSGVMASVGAAMASALPVLKKVFAIFGEVGDMIPETPEEAENQGMETEWINESQTINDDDDEFYDEDGVEYDFDETDEEWEEDEDFGRMSGCSIQGYSDGVYFIDDAISGLSGEYLGLGLFVGQLGALGKAKKVKAKKANRKSKRALKKIKKQQSKNDKKQPKLTKKQTKVADNSQKKLAKAKTDKQRERITSKANKKQERIANKKQKVYDKTVKKVSKQQATYERYNPITVAPLPAPNPDEDFDMDETNEMMEQIINKGLDNSFNKQGIENGAKVFKDLVDKGQQAINTMELVTNSINDKNQEAVIKSGSGNNGNNEPSFIEKWKWPLSIGGAVLLTIGVWKLAQGNKGSEGNKK